MNLPEENKLIAEFMGLPINKYHESTWPENMKYHLSWNELMPVVDKIVKIKLESIKENEDDNRIKIEIYYPHCELFVGGIYSHDGCWEGCRFNVGFYTNEAINNAWQLVIQFVQWYNKTK